MITFILRFILLLLSFLLLQMVDVVDLETYDLFPITSFTTILIGVRCWLALSFIWVVLPKSIKYYKIVSLGLIALNAYLLVKSSKVNYVSSFWEQADISYHILVTIAVIGFLLLFRGFFVKRKVLLGLVLFATFAYPFIRSTPDTLMSQNYDSSVEQTSRQLRRDSVIVNTLGLDNSRYLVVVASADCRFCKLSANKIRLMIEKNNINTAKFTLALSSTSEESGRLFQSIIDANQWEVKETDFRTLSSMSGGSFPRFYTVENKHVVAKHNYRSLTEGYLKGI
ncbi:MAG: hypothetical protein AB8B61_08380 [Cyclobacteriaceae bacterium]